MKNYKSKIIQLAHKQYFLHTSLVPVIHILIVYKTIKESEYPMTDMEAWISVVLIFLISCISLIVSKFLLNKKINAYIATTLFLGLSFSYGLIGKNIFQLNSLASLAQKAFFGNMILASISLISFTFFFLVYILSIIPFKLNRFNNYLNILLFLFLLIEVKNLYSYEPKKIKLEEEVKIEQTSISGDSSLPNIFYIVLDSYTSFESLRTYWKYDNSELVNYLKKNGFYIARRSKSNYNQTHFSLASLLNLSYLHYESFDKLTFAHYPNLFKLIKDNVLARVLEKNGYEIINYSLFDISNISKYYRFELIDEPHFFKNTMFEGVVNVDKVGSALGINFTPETNIIKTNMKIASLLKDVALTSSDRNFFVYAHFMLPHPPYYFDANGNIMPENYARDDYNKWKYLEQLKFTNKLLMEIIDYIFSNSSIRPVIIIQGDHGFRFLKDKVAQGAESHSILNAFYFSDKDYKQLYQTISSVNTFRVLLNKYKLLELETLPDERFFVAKGIGFN